MGGKNGNKFKELSNLNEGVKEEGEIREEPEVETREDQEKSIDVGQEGYQKFPRVEKSNFEGRSGASSSTTRFMQKYS